MFLYRYEPKENELFYQLRDLRLPVTWDDNKTIKSDVLTELLNLRKPALKDQLLSRLSALCKLKIINICACDLCDDQYESIHITIGSDCEY